MARVIAGCILVMALSACSGYTVTWKSSSACGSAGEASFSCQVERYNAVGGR